MNQATLVLVKPDGLKKSLTGNILTRLSETKLEIVATKMARVSRELAAEHYQHLKDKPFFDDVVKYLQGEFHDRRKVMALVYWGKDAINKVREIAGCNQSRRSRLGLHQRLFWKNNHQRCLRKCYPRLKRRKRRRKRN